MRVRHKTWSWSLKTDERSGGPGHSCRLSIVDGLQGSASAHWIGLAPVTDMRIDQSAHSSSGETPTAPGNLLWMIVVASKDGQS